MQRPVLFMTALCLLAGEPNPAFKDITEASGVKFINVASHTSKKYLIETMGSGVALFDFDNDGRLDLFLVNGAPLTDPTPTGAIPRKRWPALLESSLPSKAGPYI